MSQTSPPAGRLRLLLPAVAFAVVLLAGIGAWLGTVAVGMLLRVVAGQGTAPAFIAVALCFLGLFLLGWRVVAAIVARWRSASRG